jgi:diadenosine tetraphosphate (Ap4A) HIT family hydrolase
MNATAEKFGFPDSVVKRTGHWLVLVRPAQPTLGSLVLVCTDPAESLGAISAEAGRELPQVVAEIERVLGDAFGFEKINYLMLMMVDPDVHFHVLPRSSAERVYAGRSFLDTSWPGPPDITAANEFDAELKAELTADLKARFG